MPRILVVEDDAGIRLGVTRNLEFEGHQVTAAATGEEGADAETHTVGGNAGTILVIRRRPCRQGTNAGQRRRP